MNHFDSARSDPTPPRFPPASRRLWAYGWIVVAALPVAYIITCVVIASRNIVFWDEFDTALDLILRIHAGADWSELLRRFFAINNEHRTVTSRLIFALSYWLTGTVNFHVIGAIGNLFLVGTCAILIGAARTWERRIRIGVVLAFLMFQLEHFENLLWSGASIDHFQVVMLAIGAVAALARGSWGGVVVGFGLGLLATFTLAQGNMVWPVGAALLACQRRWLHLACWIVGGIVAVAAFLHGFSFNPAHHISEITLRDLTLYWLALLGAPLTLGHAGYAPIPGAILLLGFGLCIARGALTREPVAMFGAAFAIGALGMIALGRSEIAGPEINSRYMVLGALAWSLLIFILLEFATPPEKPFRLLAWLLPALAAFNIAADIRYAPMAEGFIEVRDRAATSFMQHGVDGRGITRLHPQDGHADVLLKMAAERGIYEFPRVSYEKTFPEAAPTTRIITYIDELLLNDRAVTAGGWAMLPGHVSRRGEVFLMLRSPKSTLFFSSVTLQRPDVAKAYQQPGWRSSGFRVVIPRSLLPAEDFEVGVLIATGNRAEYIMTKNRLELAGPQPKAFHAVLTP